MGLMRFRITGKNFDITEALKDRVVKKIGKLDKFFSPDTEVQVTMGVERNRHIFEVTIPYNGVVFRAEVDNEDMYACIDKSVDIIEKQIGKNKSRLEKRLREGAFVPAHTDLTLEAAETAEVEEEREFKIVRTKKFAIKPMAVDEAVMQMNLVGHEFFVFSNADTNKVNVVYRRKNGDYGLIEPEF